MLKSSGELPSSRDSEEDCMLSRVVELQIHSMEAHYLFGEKLDARDTDQYDQEAMEEFLLQSSD